FIHTGKPRSFVYDIADIFKFETVVPAAFRTVADGHLHPDRQVRISCRDSFRKTQILKRLIPMIAEVLAAGGIPVPPPPKESVPPAIPLPQAIGDEGHRS